MLHTVTIFNDPNMGLKEVSSPLGKKRVVFFDLDGTLHQQDIFGGFLRFMLWRMPQNLLLLLPLSPFILLGLLLQGWEARWPMSLLLWGITFGHHEARLQALERQFVALFRHNMVEFPKVLQRVEEESGNEDNHVWVISGSPQRLVAQIYYDRAFISQVHLLGSQMRRCRGGWVLSLRCLGKEKVTQLAQRLGEPLQLYRGYSDSSRDMPLLSCCEQRFRVTANGELQPWE